METMDAIYARVCGLDVHKKSVVACRRRLTSSGRVEKEVATFGTTTAQLLALLAWLQRVGRDACGDGINRGILEARVEHSGRSRGVVVGQRASLEDRAGSQNGRQGLRSGLRS